VMTDSPWAGKASITMREAARTSVRCPTGRWS
jgi:hypothetical protein